MRMPAIPSPTFSDAELGQLQRAFWAMPEAEAPPKRERKGHPTTAKPRRLVIVDGDKLHRLMVARGFDVATLSVAAGLWAAKPGRKLVAQALDYGELNPDLAAKVARALSCEVQDFTLGIRVVEPGPARGYIRKRNGRS